MDIDNIKKHFKSQLQELKYIVFARTEEEYLSLKRLGFKDSEIVKEYKNNS